MSIIQEIMNELRYQIDFEDYDRSHALNWLKNLTDEEILSYYISKNPDKKLTQFSEKIIAILTKISLVGIDIRFKKMIYSVMYL